MIQKARSCLYYKAYKIVMNITNSFEIIDFHVHPYANDEQNVVYYKRDCNMQVETTLKVMDDLGVSKFCGRPLAPSLSQNSSREEKIQRLYKINDTALQLKEIYGDRYIPGFNVTPRLVKESCAEIERMHRNGFRLIGELTPYLDGWVDLQSSKEFYEILEFAKTYDMVVSIHDEVAYADDIDKLLQENRGIRFVIAHPNAFSKLERNIARLRRNDNVYIDLSGNGIFYNGVTRKLIDEVGADRILFGSDYPICSLGAFAGSVVFDPFLSDLEKEKILSLNVKKLLNI